jgi:exodeoxyribonuclease V alpha subunit
MTGTPTGANVVRPLTPGDFRCELALGAGGLLGEFNQAGVLTAADVHVARRLGAIGAEPDESVLLAFALVVRSTRHGSVVLDLATAEATTSPDDEESDVTAERLVDGVALPGMDQLSWPAPVEWARRCAASPLNGGPLRVVGSRIWLSRYWDQEEQVATELLARSAAPPADLDLPVLAAGLSRLFPLAEDADQRQAAAVCALSPVSVLAGGPGTGKTTTVARLLALLREQHPSWRIALAAPTGKAAARLEEAVRSSTALLPPQDQDRLGNLPATTLHRMLGWRPDARSRFRHDRHNRLPVEIVVVDESSMVSLTMMARLLEALRPSTRLVMVGDPDQLASVEAGAVLGDLVDRTTLGRRTVEFAQTLRSVLPDLSVAKQSTSPETVFRNGVSTLSTNRRFSAGGEIAALASAIRDGDRDLALAVLHSATAAVEFVEVDDEARIPEELLTGVRAEVQAMGAALHSAAAAGDAPAALAALERHRLLCAHRRGPRGVQQWSVLAAGWIGEQHPVVPRPDGRYAGEPLLVTTNDYDAGLYNGDTGVVVEASPGPGSVAGPADDSPGSDLVAVFGRGGAPIPVALARLGAVRPLHAMTVHRSQGSQFDRITVLLPAAGSPLGTRETLYTAVTRAREHVRVIGSAEAFAAAVLRPAARATGLRERLQVAHS